MTTSSAARILQDETDHSTPQCTTATPLFTHSPVMGSAGTSPVHDQQLMLERRVLHSMSARQTEHVSHDKWKKVAIVLGISITGWCGIFGVGMHLLG